MAEPSPKSQACWPGFWTGIGGALLTALFAMLLLPGLTMGAFEDKLEKQANAALRAEGLTWASVRMEGQRAILSGAAPTEALKRKAHDVALTSSGAGGPYAGGVTQVINEALVGSAVSPYTWSVRRTAQGVRLAGHVPSEAIKAALVQRARQMFNAQPEDLTKLAPGAPQGDWQRAALWGMEQVAQLTSGEARLVDGRIVVIGEGPAAAVEQVKARAAMGPAPGFEASADVTVTGQGLGIRELQGVDLTNATPEVCTNAFARLMQNNVITFAVDSDVIDPKSAPLLESLIRVAVRCDSAKIEVSGHTDVTGDPAQNFALSQRRANSVRLYLIERGVLDDRITAQGFGSTRPIAPNNTPAGQAANRRIEFRVAS